MDLQTRSLSTYHDSRVKIIKGYEQPHSILRVFVSKSTTAAFFEPLEDIGGKLLDMSLIFVGMVY